MGLSIYNILRDRLSKLVSLAVILLTLLSTSCIREDADLDDCPPADLSPVFRAVAIPVGVTGNPVNEVAFYVFDHNRRFIDSINTKANTPITLNYPGQDRIYIVTWGNCNDGLQLMPALIPGDPIDSATVALKTTHSGNRLVASSPSDLFWGYASVDLSNPEGDTITNEVFIRRKVASVRITSRGLQEYAQTTDTDFTYILSDTHGSISFDGNYSGDLIVYNPDAYFNNNYEFITSVFYTLPSLSTHIVSVEIRKGEQLIFSATKDKAGNPLRLIAGEFSDFLIDFTNNSVEVELSIKDWNSIYIDEEF